MGSLFHRLGLQQRTMLYAAAWLVLFFSAFAYLAFSSLRQTTKLVHEERLMLARNVAAALEQSFDHVVSDVLEETYPALSRPSPELAQELYRHLTQVDKFALFQVTSVWVAEPAGGLVGAPSGTSAIEGWQDEVALTRGQGVVRVFHPSPAPGPSFATIATPLADGRVVLATTDGVSSPTPFNPYLPLELAWGKPPLIPPAQGEGYNLEIINSRGEVMLGMGPLESRGEITPHWPLLKEAVVRPEGAVHQHQGEMMKPHMVVAVPLPRSPYYVVLEQDLDVALALPLELRRQWLLLGGIGLFLALALVWLTTRQVVQPLSQLVAEARRMARGDLSNPIALRAQDEMGELAENFEGMRSQLKAALEALDLSNRELEARVKERTARIEEVLGKVITAQEEERKRLARELHDDTAQTLATLTLTLDALRDGIGEQTPALRAQVVQARELTHRLLEETRKLILDLRPTVLDDLGLLPALRWYAERHLEPLGIEVSLVGGIGRLPPSVEVALFRIVQEALNNIARHSGARHARVELGVKEGKVRVMVEDDGRGFNPQAVLATGLGDKAVGLVGMRERASLLGGKLDLASTPGAGTRIQVSIPLFREE